MKLIYCLFFICCLQSICLTLPPEALLKFQQYCTYYNYPSQAFNVTTPDGYIITIFRVQTKNTSIVQGKQPIILQHGLLQSSDEWIVNSPDKAIAFILADQNYDVWVTNVRGNLYGLNHVNLTTADKQFWEFSFDQMAAYDIPTHFNFIANKTAFKQIDYIGQSQGTLVMFIALSIKQPIVLQYLRKCIQLAPVVFIGNAKSQALKILAGSKYVKPLIEYLGINNFLPYNEKVSSVLATFCFENQDTCKDIFGGIIGGNPDLVNYDRIPEILGHAPGGTSSQNMFHFQQYLNTGEFKMYDYGNPIANKKHYNQTTPPFYDLDNIKQEIHLFAGYLDSLADPIDVTNLYHILQRKTKVSLRYLVQGHSSWILGKDMSYFSEVLDILRN